MLEEVVRQKHEQTDMDCDPDDLRNEDNRLLCIGHVVPRFSSRVDFCPQQEFILTFHFHY